MPEYAIRIRLGAGLVKCAPAMASLPLCLLTTLQNLTQRPECCVTPCGSVLDPQLRLEALYDTTHFRRAQFEILLIFRIPLRGMSSRGLSGPPWLEFTIAVKDAAENRGLYCETSMQKLPLNIGTSEHRLCGSRKRNKRLVHQGPAQRHVYDYHHYNHEGVRPRKRRQTSKRD